MEHPALPKGEGSNTKQLTLLDDGEADAMDLFYYYPINDCAV